MGRFYVTLEQVEGSSEAECWKFITDLQVALNEETTDPTPPPPGPADLQSRQDIGVDAEHELAAARALTDKAYEIDRNWNRLYLLPASGT